MRILIRRAVRRAALSVLGFSAILAQAQISASAAAEQQLFFFP
jgi:hypothetical protein